MSLFASQPAVAPAPVQPSREDPAVEEARRREVVAQRKQTGRSATLLTGGQGALGEPALGRKSLLGGAARGSA